MPDMKVTDRQVREIRSLRPYTKGWHHAPISLVTIGARYGISASLVSRILSGKRR